jgi:hypothetical protein
MRSKGIISNFLTKRKNGKENSNIKEKKCEG